VKIPTGFSPCDLGTTWVNKESVGKYKMIESCVNKEEGWFAIRFESRENSSVSLLIIENYRPRIGTVLVNLSSHRNHTKTQCPSST
jgi:hypothetical protein